MLIPGGLGETEESREMTERMIARITEAHKNLAAGGDGGPAFLDFPSGQIRHMVHPSRQDA